MRITSSDRDPLVRPRDAAAGFTAGREAASAPRRRSAKDLAKRAVYAIGNLCPIEPKDVSKAVWICGELAKKGISTTMGKFSRDGDSARQIVRELELAIESMARQEHGARFFLSLKPPALEFDPELTSFITAFALRHDQAVHFDAHRHDQADPTIELLARLVREFGPTAIDGDWRFGLSLPARWKRTLDDARWARDNSVMPRIVKGEFPAERESDETDARKSFLTLVDLFAAEGAPMAIATHDYALAEEAIARAVQGGARLHMELLFGMPCLRLVALAKAHRIPIRFYIPYGDTLFVYGVKHLLTNPHKIKRPGFREFFKSLDGKLAATLSAG